MADRDLRLILTKNCNYHCTFCHQEGVTHEIFKTLTNDDYVFLYKTLRDQENISGVTLTGGEPLMYQKIVSLCKLLHDSNAKITLVSNGSLLNRFHEIGEWVHRMNISLHTLDQKEYVDITQTKTRLDHILNNIQLMRKFYPNLLIRLNATVVKGRNDNKEDILALVNFADQYGLSIKFVELYPKTDPDFVSLQSIEGILEELGFEKYQEKPRQIIYGRGKRIIILTKISCGATGEEDNIVSPEDCDIFVSPDGLISPYPSSDHKVSLYDAVKKRDAQEVESIVQQAIDECKVPLER